MVRSFADWIFNLMLWGAVIAIAALLYEVFMMPGAVTAAQPMHVYIAAGVVVVLAALWPRLS